MIAILSDIHSNYEAFTEVIKDMSNFQIDSIYVLGDIVGYGPDPDLCVELVKKHNMLAIKGNHERALEDSQFLRSFNPVAARIITWTKETINSKNSEYLKSLPTKITKPPISFVHGSFIDPDKYLLESPDIAEDVEELRENELKIEFFGHTHMRMIFMEEEKPVPPESKWMKLNPNKIYLINPGSVGQPRDRSSYSSYLLFDPIKNSILFRDITYPVQKTIAKMKQKDFPPFTYNRLRMGI